MRAHYYAQKALRPGGDRTLQLHAVTLFSTSPSLHTEMLDCSFYMQQLRWSSTRYGNPPKPPSYEHGLWAVLPGIPHVCIFRFNINLSFTSPCRMHSLNHLHLTELSRHCSKERACKSVYVIGSEVTWAEPVWYLIMLIFHIRAAQVIVRRFHSVICPKAGYLPLWAKACILTLFSHHCLQFVNSYGCQPLTRRTSF